MSGNQYQWAETHQKTWNHIKLQTKGEKGKLGSIHQFIRGNKHKFSQYFPFKAHTRKINNIPTLLSSINDLYRRSILPIYQRKGIPKPLLVRYNSSIPTLASKPTIWGTHIFRGSLFCHGNVSYHLNFFMRVNLAEFLTFHCKFFVPT